MELITADAYKFVKLASLYPEHGVEQLDRLMEISPLRKNNAVWRAKELGLVTISEKGEITVEGEVGYDMFSESISELEQGLHFALKRLNGDEIDMDEIMLGNWCMGYSSHDTLLAINKLIDEGNVAMYTVKNEEGSLYVCYTLPQNLHHHWGVKAFPRKKNLMIEDSSRNVV